MQFQQWKLVETLVEASDIFFEAAQSIIKNPAEILQNPYKAPLKASKTAHNL